MAYLRAILNVLTNNCLVMHWFLNPVQHHYADFSGRTSRQAFWMFMLFYFLIYVVVAIIAGVIRMEWIAFVFSLAVWVPSIAITARRLHDINKSGWWQLIGLIPLLGFIIMIYFLVQKGNAEANQYGPVPVDDGSSAEAVPVASADMAPEAAAPAAEGETAPVQENNQQQ